MCPTPGGNCNSANDAEKLHVHSLQTEGLFADCAVQTTSMLEESTPERARPFGKPASAPTIGITLSHCTTVIQWTEAQSASDLDSRPENSSSEIACFKGRTAADISRHIDSRKRRYKVADAVKHAASVTESPAHSTSKTVKKPLTKPPATTKASLTNSPCLVPNHQHDHLPNHPPQNGCQPRRHLLSDHLRRLLRHSHQGPVEWTTNSYHNSKQDLTRTRSATGSVERGEGYGGVELRCWFASMHFQT